MAPEDAGAFRDSIASLRENNRYAAAVAVYSEEEYRQMRLFVTDDGSAGVALKGDEIVSVYAKKDGAYPRCGRALLATAVAQGGRRLDCYDTVLPKLYAEEGFRPVARVRWNDEYAPDDWDYDTFDGYNHGRPDVVFMAYDPDSLNRPYQPGEGRYVTDYDDGLAAARDALR